MPLEKQGGQILSNFTLRKYQEEAIQQFEQARGGSDNRFLLTMATGAGKTIVTSFIMRDEVRENGGRCLFLVHRDELIKQTVDKLSQVDESLRIGVMQGKQDEWGDDYDVSVASVQTISRAARLEKYPRDLFTLIIVDETHRVAAESYGRVLRHFRAFEDDSPTTLLGVTATADRTDGVSLGDTYQQHVYNVGILDLIKVGALVPIKALMVKTEADLSSVKKKAGDFSDTELANILNTENRNTLIALAMKEHAAERKSIVFAVNVKHAEDLAKTLRAHGIKARAVSAQLTKAQRERALSDFAKGRLQVLVSVQLLVEGYDEPTVSCVVWATKTMSSIKFAQGIGRGTRLSPETGKTDLLVIDCADTSGKHSKALQSVPRMFGMGDAGGDALNEGKDVLEALKVDEQAKEEEEERKKAEAERKEQAKVVGVKLKAISFDLFAAEAEVPGFFKQSRFPWLAVDPTRFFVPLFEDRQVHVYQNRDGSYGVALLNAITFTPFRIIAPRVSLSDAYELAQQYLTKNEQRVLASMRSMERKEPSHAQLKIVRGITREYQRTMFDAWKLIALSKTKKHFVRAAMMRAS